MPLRMVADGMVLSCGVLIQAASEQMATAQQAGLTADELSTIRVFQVLPTWPAIVALAVTTVASMGCYMHHTPCTSPAVCSCVACPLYIPWLAITGGRCLSA